MVTTLKRLTLLVIAVLMLAACAEQQAVAPTLAPTSEPAPAVVEPTSEPSPAPTDEPAPAAEPTEEPVVEEEPAESVTEQATETTAAGICEEPIYLAIIWHQHQPVYFKDPVTNAYERPWVRVHATKDYVDMVSILEEYPDIHATFNLTPSLIRQLDDLAAGATDLYWIHTEIPAEELTDEQKQFILDRFFDINREIVGRFPRYGELLALRDNSDDPLTAYSDADFRDLQVLFNLGWTDPDWLAEEPLAALVAKGRDFAEEDKQIVLDEHQRLIEEVIPVHRAFQDSGQIEVTMTPFAHPILPLLISTDLATQAMPDVVLPAERFLYGQDAVAQVELGVQLYEEHFGRPPVGMWPAEGSVAQEIVSMVAGNGIKWMASDEGVLANSLGMESFTRNAAEVVTEADMLYRPYYVEGVRGGPVAMVFRDVDISDRVGFTYSGLPGQQAADDFISRIGAICDELTADGAEGPHLVSVILDGENAWEFYENDGKEFLHALYQGLSDDPSIITVTPSEFLEIAPDQPTIDELWAGSWINHDFSTWIGEEEENRAWDLLKQTRDRLQTYLTGRRQGEATEEQVQEALTQMYIAEGSDWFWWYGSDQTSGNDESFDRQYRETLKQVYLALGEEPPAILDVPIIPEQPAAADQPLVALLTPDIDGQLGEGEWEGAGQYLAAGGVMASASTFFESVSYAFDARNLYLNFTIDPNASFPFDESRVDLYLSVPGSGDASNFSEGGALLGFAANRRLALTFDNGEMTSVSFYRAAGDGWEAAGSSEATDGTVVIDHGESLSSQIAAGDGVVEIGVPLALLGNAETGSTLTMRAFFQARVGDRLSDVDQLPLSGPAQAVVPDLGNTVVVLDVADPELDDHGPGTYSYPQDTVFKSGNFDITNFQVGYDDNNVVFRFKMRGPVDNPWDGPNGLSLQTFDIYIDQDGDGSGGDALLPGRNLTVVDGSGWDYAIHVEGWTSAIYTPGEEGPQEIAQSSDFQVTADPGQQQVTIRVPKALIGDNPEAWRYAAMVMSQEGFPSSGVMRIRDVTPSAEQWRIGGAPPLATNHTRVLDLVWPEAGQQEAWLSDFDLSNTNQTELTAADFARIDWLETAP